MSLLEKIFDWITKELPGIIGAFAFGYKRGTGKIDDVKKELVKSEIGKQQLANKIFIDQKYDGVSDDDIVKSAIEGTKSSKPKPDGE